MEKYVSQGGLDGFGNAPLVVTDPYLTLSLQKKYIREEEGP